MQNQERAYIAASRRSDRGLEARYQSALMASEMHQRRTGKSLRITHEIVINEEMYEEEDNMLPQSKPLCQKRIQPPAMAQTDACIAAIIARRAGLPNPFQQNQGFVASQPTKSMSWSPLTTYEPASDEYATQPLQQEPELNPPEDTVDPLNESNAIGMLQTPEDQNFAMVPCFMDTPLLCDATPREHELSITSSMSDISSHDLQFPFGTYLEGGSSSTSASSTELNECMVDFNDERDLLSFIQNGEVVGYE